MIDINKQYTYNDKPVRIYADGSDTSSGNIHGAWYCKDSSVWNMQSFLKRDLVEVWAPKEGDLCYFWDDADKRIIVSRLKYTTNSRCYKYETMDNCAYEYCAPFNGTLPEAFKGLV